MKLYSNPRFSLFAVISFIMVATNSCFKKEVEPIRGCTNPQSLNYNSKATEDDGSCCLKTVTSKTASVNGSDFRAFSPYYNKVVAVFNFEQTSNSYTGRCSETSSCNTTLQIKNTTTKTIAFDYNIVFKLNFVQWNYQGYATIPPTETLDVGTINSNCASISLGQMLIQSANITYQ